MFIIIYILGHFIQMSFLLTQNDALLLRKLIQLDMKDAPYNCLLLLFSRCDIKLYLINLLTKGCLSNRDRSYLMKYILRRIIAKMPAALYRHALTLVATGQCAAAMVYLNLAITRGHLPSCALKAWILIKGREGVAKDHIGSFKLVDEGARLGCRHCQGVLAWHYRWGDEIRRDTARSLKLAYDSSDKGSRYGIFVLGRIFHIVAKENGTQDYSKVIELYNRAAEMYLDEAQCSLGFLYSNGLGITQDSAEALRLFQLAAHQRHPVALVNMALCYQFGDGVKKDMTEALRLLRLAAAQGDLRAMCEIGNCYENGKGVKSNQNEAICWYRRAHAAGYLEAEKYLTNLGVSKKKIAHWYSTAQVDKLKRCKDPSP